MTATIKQKRGAKGRFVESSELAKAILSVRLKQEIHPKFVEIAERQGKSPTVLLRELAEEFVKNQEPAE